MKTYLSSLLITAAMFFGAAHTAGQEQYTAFGQSGNESVTMVTSTCSQWTTVTLDYAEATWSQTTIQVSSCYDWWKGARTAEGIGLMDRTEGGKWQVDPRTYEMVWQTPEAVNYTGSSQDSLLQIAALSF
jgi:hypothetical protein